MASGWGARVCTGVFQGIDGAVDMSINTMIIDSKTRIVTTYIRQKSRRRLNQFRIPEHPPNSTDTLNY
jgi:hypothetical protein